MSLLFLPRYKRTYMSNFSSARLYYVVLKGSCTSSGKLPRKKQKVQRETCALYGQLGGLDGYEAKRRVTDVDDSHLFYGQGPHVKTLLRDYVLLLPGSIVSTHELKEKKVRCERDMPGLPYML